MARRRKAKMAAPLVCEVPTRMWFKTAGWPAGEKTHLLVVSPAGEPRLDGPGSLCGEVGAERLGYPWADHEPGIGTAKSAFGCNKIFGWACRMSGRGGAMGRNSSWSWSTAPGRAEGPSGRENAS